LNKGTEKGKELIGKSLRQFGAGRSVLIDKNNRIIAGNKTHENAVELGMDDVIVVETDGSKLVAVKRTDIDLDTKKGREMALADNATVKVDLEWDADELNAVTEDFDIDSEDWGVSIMEDTENPYTQKVESPVYTAKEDEPPTLDELCDVWKRDELCEKIDGANVPKEVKDFLKLASMRHVVFHYDKIAEYYCHAPKEVQELMEESALIIIDFEDAIGGGYVRARVELETEFDNEYGN
jgi:hypothetical protein